MGSGPRKNGTRTAKSAGASSANSGKNASGARMADHRQPSAIRKRRTAAKPKPVPDKTHRPQERGPEPLADERSMALVEDPPPHLAAAVAAAAAARAAAARIRATCYGVGGENRVEVPSTIGEKSRRLSSPRQKSPNLGCTAPPTQPGMHSAGKPTDLDTSPRFTRTMSMARQVLEEEGKSGFWHLQLLEEQEAPNFWRRLAGWHRGRHAVFPSIERDSSGRSEAAVIDRRSHGELRPEQIPQLALRGDTANSDNTRDLGASGEGLPAVRHGAPSSEDQASIGLCTHLDDSQAEDPTVRTAMSESCALQCDLLQETTPLSSNRALVPVAIVSSMPERLSLARGTEYRYPAGSGAKPRRRAPHQPFAHRPQGVSHTGAGSDSASLLRLEPMVDVVSAPRVDRASRRYLTIGAALVAGTMLGTILSASPGALYPRDRDLLERIARSWSTFALSVEFGSRNAVESYPGLVSAAQSVVLGKPESTNDASPRAEISPAINSQVERPPDVPIAEQQRTRVNRADDSSQLVPADGAAGSDRPAALEPRRPQPQWQDLYALGHKLQQRGGLAAASDAYRRAAELNPTHSWILYDWGYVLALQGDQAGAVEKYRRAIELNPKHPYAYYDLGYLLHRRGDDEGAITNFEIARQLNPTNPFVYHDLGHLLEKRGEIGRALQMYRRAVEVGPDSRAGRASQRRIAALTGQQSD